MQVTLKQSEITAAIAAYLTNVLGVSNVSPETLSVVYKQGRSDKNGMTAELDIEAPAYHKPADVQKTAEVLPSKVVDGQLSASLTHEVAARSNDNAVAASTVGESLGNASASTPTEAISASAAQAPEVAPAEVAQDPEQAGLADPTPVYEGERRAEPREEVPAEPEAQVAPAAEDEARAEEPAKAAEPVAAASPLFG